MAGERVSEMVQKWPKNARFCHCNLADVMIQAKFSHRWSSPGAIDVVLVSKIEDIDSGRRDLEDFVKVGDPGRIDLIGLCFFVSGGGTSKISSKWATPAGST